MINFALLQICDSNFPIGSFSHSYGFETWLQNGKIENQAGFESWFWQYLSQQLLTSDGLALRLAYEALEEDDFSKLRLVNEKLNAQLLSKEIRDGNQRMGRQFLKLAEAVTNGERLVRYRQMLQANQLAPHPVFVFGILCYEGGATLEETLGLYFYNTITTLVQNAVRGVPLGQIAGQKLIAAAVSQIDDWTARLKTLDEGLFGAVVPGLEIAQMQHEYLFARNFMS